MMNKKGLAYDAYYLNREGRLKIGLFFYLYAENWGRTSWVDVGDRKVLLVDKHVLVMKETIDNLKDEKDLDEALECIKLELLFS